MNAAAINICVQLFCGRKFSTHLGKFRGAQLLDCMVKNVFSFIKPGF